MRGRGERLAALLAEGELDRMLVTDLVNVRWLTGFTGSNGLALIGPGDQRLFLTDFRYLTQSGEQLDDGWRREIASDCSRQVSTSEVSGTVRPTSAARRRCSSASNHCCPVTALVTRASSSTPSAPAASRSASTNLCWSSCPST